MNNILTMTSNIEDEIIKIRRDIHQNPELSFQEYRTSDLIEKYLKSLSNLEVSRIGETGIVGLLNGRQPSQKVIALRSDIDALPISETTNLSFASKIPGKMHACGHDVHISVLLGAANILSQLVNEFNGTIKFIFQPAEEKLSGAEEMVKKGVLSNPRVDHIIGFHCWPEIPLGTIGLRKGAMFAASDSINLKIKGVPGHAAHPHQVIDPIIISAHIIVALQTIVSRELEPIDSAVLSFGQIKGGTAPNIIPDQVELSGTVRTIDINTRNSMQERIERIAGYVANGLRGEIELGYIPGCGPVISDEELNQKLEVAVSEVLGEDKIVFLKNPSMGSEDFSFYLEKIPGMYFRIGTRKPNDPFIPLHSSNFKVEEKSISIGIAALVATVLKYFN